MFQFFRRRSPDLLDKSAPPFAGNLALIVIAIAMANAALWCSGIRQAELLEGVEAGAAVVEENAAASMEPEQIRESIRLQRQSINFWSTLAILGDFIVAPLLPVLRAFVVTVAFCALAALLGRPVGYGVAMADNVAWQIFWAAGVVLESAMQIVVSPNAVNSWIVMLPPKDYPATTAVALALLNPLAVCGWLAMGFAAWRRKQANVVVALITVAVVAIVETSFLSSFTHWFNALIRLNISFG